jgi:hypothetical protein
VEAFGDAVVAGEAGSSALPTDHRSRRFNPRPLHTVCDRSERRNVSRCVAGQNVTV